MVAFDFEGVALGLVGEKSWTREGISNGTPAEKSKKSRKTRIEEKESYRWLEGLHNLLWANARFDRLTVSRSTGFTRGAYDYLEPWTHEAAGVFLRGQRGLKYVWALRKSSRAFNCSFVLFKVKVKRSALDW